MNLLKAKEGLRSLESAVTPLFFLRCHQTQREAEESKHEVCTTNHILEKDGPHKLDMMDLVVLWLLVACRR